MVAVLTRVRLEGMCCARSGRDRALPFVHVKNAPGVRMQSELCVTLRTTSGEREPVYSETSDPTLRHGWREYNRNMGSRGLLPSWGRHCHCQTGDHSLCSFQADPRGVRPKEIRLPGIKTAVGHKGAQNTPTIGIDFGKGHTRFSKRTAVATDRCNGSAQFGCRRRKAWPVWCWNGFSAGNSCPPGRGCLAESREIRLVQTGTVAFRCEPKSPAADRG